MNPVVTVFGFLAGLCTTFAITVDPAFAGCATWLALCSIDAMLNP